jgi:hypothetical protein
LYCKTGTLRVATIEQAVADDVRFESSMDARSARMDCRFYMSLLVSAISVKLLRNKTYNDIRNQEVNKNLIRESGDDQ